MGQHEASRFSQGEPWLASNPDRISAENELKNKSSVFYTYQRLIQYRKQYDIFTEGSYRLLEPSHPQLFLYERILGKERLLAAGNFSGQWCRLALPEGYEAGTILESNYGRSSLEQNDGVKALREPDDLSRGIGDSAFGPLWRAVSSYYKTGKKRRKER